jgi:hypothetical protein
MGAIEINSDQIWSEWNRAMDKIESDVPKIKKSLEDSFRDLLGVFEATLKSQT